MDNTYKNIEEYNAEKTKNISFYVMKFLMTCLATKGLME